MSQTPNIDPMALALQIAEGLRGAEDPEAKSLLKFIERNQASAAKLELTGMRNDANLQAIRARMANQQELIRARLEGRMTELEFKARVKEAERQAKIDAESLKRLESTREINAARIQAGKAYARSGLASEETKAALSAYSALDANAAAVMRGRMEDVAKMRAPREADAILQQLGANVSRLSDPDRAKIDELALQMAKRDPSAMQEKERLIARIASESATAQREEATAARLRKTGLPEDKIAALAKMTGEEAVSAEASALSKMRRGKMLKYGVGGAIGAAVLAGLAKSIMSKDEGPKMDPMMQIALAQQLGGAQDGGVNTSQTLRDMGKMLAIIKQLQDMAAMQSAGPQMRIA